MKVSKNKKVIAGVSVVIIVIGYLLYSGLRDSMIYYYRVSEMVVQRDNLLNMSIRMSGKVLEGSIQYDYKSLRLDFIASDEEGQIPVRYQGVLPDTFKEGREVILEGQLNSAGVFEATNILTKCPSKYSVKIE